MFDLAVPLACFVFTVLWSGLSGALVSIDQASFPLYVKAGGNLTLVCKSSESQELEWVEQTRGTNLDPVVIVPTANGPFITRYLIEKPSGYVENTLLKTNMAASDGGLYQCRDAGRENQFGLWATVISINSNGGTVHANANDQVNLYCYISGFNSNPPEIVYDWFYEDYVIRPPHHHYDIVVGDGATQLTITDPVKSDAGQYTCSFTLSTNLGPVTFSDTISLDTSSLEDSGGKAVTGNRFTCVVLACLASLWLRKTLAMDP